MGQPSGWLLHHDGSELACTLAMPTPGHPTRTVALDRTVLDSSHRPGAGSTGVPSGRKTGRPPFTMGIVYTAVDRHVSLVMLEPPTWGSSPLYSRNCQTLGAAPAGGSPPLTLGTKDKSMKPNRGGFVPIGELAGTLPGLVQRGRAMSANTRSPRCARSISSSRRAKRTPTWASWRGCSRGAVCRAANPKHGISTSGATGRMRST